jgi:hypothetical protein
MSDRPEQSPPPPPPRAARPTGTAVATRQRLPWWQRSIVVAPLCLVGVVAVVWGLMMLRPPTLEREVDLPIPSTLPATGPATLSVGK